MQTLLLTVASVIILAVAAAFGAPYYVDWNQWRSTFETQAARTLGAPVVIRGPIEAEILPIPRLLLRDVSIGADGVGTGIAVEELRANLALGSLIKGEIVADHARLVKPRMRLVLDATGKVALPTGAGRPSGFTISSLAIENGTLELLDRAAGRSFKLDDIDMRGEAGSVVGPFKLEGEVQAGQRRQTVRLSLAAFAPDASAKLRASVQGLGSPLAFEADGVFRLASGQPAYEGRASLAMPAREGAATPLAKAGWSLAGTLRATREMVEAQDLSLSLGNMDKPVELTGNGRLGIDPATAGQPPARQTARLDLSLAARQIDLNAATAGSSPLTAMGEIAQALAPLSNLAPAGGVNLSSDTVLLGGAPMRELKADLAWASTPAGLMWQVKGLQAKLPGRATVRTSGQIPIEASGGAQGFNGTLAFDAEDLPALVGWATPGGAALLSGLPPGAASLNAAVELGTGRVALKRATFGYGGMKLTGDVAYALPDDGKAGRIEAGLAADGIDLDALLPAIRRLLATPDGPDVALGFSGRGLRLAGITAAKVDLTLARDAQGLGIERAAITDLGGLDIAGSGRLAGADRTDEGRFEARLTGNGADGLAALGRLFGPPNAEALVRRLGPMLAPLDLKVTLETTAGRSALKAAGALGKAKGTGEVGYGGGLALTGKLGLDIADGGELLGRLGVPGLRPGLGAARLDAELSPALDARLAFANAKIAARGEVPADAQGVLRPRLDVAFDGADLARLFPAVAAAAEAGQEVPAAFAAKLTRQEETWQLDGLKGTLAGIALEGTASYAPDRPEPVTLDLALDRWNLTRALALVAGRAGGNAVGSSASGAGWADGRFAPQPFPDLGALVSLKVKRLDVPGGLALEEARLRTRLAAGAATLDEISGNLAGGTLSGNARLRRRGEVLEADGHLAITGADIIRLLAGVSAQPALTGKATIGIDLAGAGRSPLNLAQALAGQGSLVIDGFQLAGLDPRALQYVMLATERGSPPDNRRIAELLDRNLARGPLALPRVEASLSVLNGVVRTGAARQSVGSQNFALEGSLDLARLSLDASVEMDDAADPKATAPPGAVVIWRGPLAGPDRRLDVTALGSAINMRALERETKRLEQQYGRSPVMDAGHSTDAPAVPPSLFSPTPMTPNPAAPNPSSTAAPNPPSLLSPEPAAPAPPAIAPADPAATASPEAPKPSSEPPKPAPERAEPAAPKPQPQAQRPRPSVTRSPERTPRDGTPAAAPPLPPPFVIQPDPLLRPPGTVPLAP
ncbi:AsmA family protein [Bosea sp. 117]|uniref:AsmA family protein n=1 Tax=Bosea sp. 117 TaxID=1125973 RepID=UPI000494C88B|nr:AsmA family protein [Bosea sp. 117]